jgi:hypothetical protein
MTGEEGWGWRVMAVGKTDRLISAPSRPGSAVTGARAAGGEIVVNRQDHGPPLPPLPTGLGGGHFGAGAGDVVFDDGDLLRRTIFL